MPYNNTFLNCTVKGDEEMKLKTEIEMRKKHYEDILVNGEIRLSMRMVMVMMTVMKMMMKLKLMTTAIGIFLAFTMGRHCAQYFLCVILCHPHNSSRS